MSTMRYISRPAHPIGILSRPSKWYLPIQIVFALMPCLPVAAQHYADKWHFGRDGDGLDFTPGCNPTVIVNSSMDGFEGCSSVADPVTGELLFYTNSERVWGRDEEVMPNGMIQPLPSTGQNTITQVIITPIPGSDSLYYIFTNQIQGGGFDGFGMRLASVDITLNGGNGDVVFKDSIIYTDNVSEKVTAIRHTNGTDLWVVGHEYPGNSFFAFLITSAGVQYPPVVSSAGKTYSLDNLGMDCLGEMKAAPNGDKLAVATSGQSDIEIFDFDASTGEITDPITLAAPPGTIVFESSWWYGLSFSPNNTKLYAGKQNFSDGTESIIQFDITSNDAATINASKVVISNMNDVYSLQLAPNGKIYVRRSGNYLGVINLPDLSGTACAFDPSGVNFGHPPSPPGAWGLNNYIALPSYPCQHIADGIASKERVENAVVYPNPGQDKVMVQFPDPLHTALWLELFDMTGTRVRQYRCTVGSTGCEFDVSGLASGPYIIRPASPGIGINPIQLSVAP